MDGISLEYVIGLSLTVLSGICGAAWWMSALYSTVKGIRRVIEDISDEIKDVAHKLEHIDSRLNGHEVRIVRLEERHGGKARSGP